MVQGMWLQAQPDQGACMMSAGHSVSFPLCLPLSLILFLLFLPLCFSAFWFLFWSHSLAALFTWQLPKVHVYTPCTSKPPRGLISQVWVTCLLSECHCEEHGSDGLGLGPLLTSGARVGSVSTESQGPRV